MIFDDISANLDLIAFVILVLCIVSVAITRRISAIRRPKPSSPEELPQPEKYGHLFKHEIKMREIEGYETSKSLRKAYRRNWAEKIIGLKDYHEAREIIRNLIMTNTAFLSAVLISFGLLLSGFSMLKQAGGAYPELKMLSISTFLFYSLFMLISEARILNYVPILLWVDEEVISKKQSKEKTAYIAELMDEAFDRFSDSIRAVFYGVVCVFWFFYTPAFIVVTILLTVIIVQSDLDKKLKISLF